MSEKQKFRFTDVIDMSEEDFDYIIEKQNENLRLLRKNMEEVDIDNTYFKYKLIEKWSGDSALIISDALLTSQRG